MRGKGRPIYILKKKWATNTGEPRESNSHAFAFTPHPCTTNTYHVCETSSCGGTYSDDRFAGKCDANGCDYNPYRMGNKDFYGKGKTVDTSKKFTYVPVARPPCVSNFSGGQL